MDHDEILKLVQSKRKAMGWTYKEVAKRSGISENMTYRFFQGENISLYKFLDIIDAMGIEIKII